ncbi:MAG: hypothetical protein ACRDBG_19725 [Waterburya sp.]
MKFSLNYSRTVYYNIEVEADTLEDAEAKAECELDDCGDYYEEGKDWLSFDGCSIIED